MTKEEKISYIEKVVEEYNRKHNLSPANMENASVLDYFSFNSTEYLKNVNEEEIQAEKDKLTTMEDLEFDADTEYYVMQCLRYVLMENVSDEYRKEYGLPEGNLYNMVLGDEIVSKDLSYFYKQIKKKYGDA